MENFQVAELAKKTVNLCDRVETLLQKAEKEVDTNMDYSLLDEIAKDKGRKTRIVFVGQYSAGKSSIIKMLTGDNSIEIGAAITTQHSTPYSWNDTVEILDTPGIATGIRPDHDDITYRAISQSDLLVYVITNEGFDSTLIDNFKKIAYNIDSDKVSQTQGVGKFNELILVVNKMSRMGNTIENRNLLVSDIKKLLPAEGLSDLRICFLDAESYLDGLAEDDKEIQQELFDRSGYKDFIQVLNNFADEKGFVGKLINPVQQLEECVQNNLAKITGTTGNEGLDIADSALKNKINSLYRQRRQGERELKDVFNRYSMDIRSLGREIAGKYGTENCNGIEDEVQSRLSEISSKCDGEIDSKLADLCSDIEVEFNQPLGGEFISDIVRKLPDDKKAGHNMAKEVVNGLTNLNLKPAMIKSAMTAVGLKKYAKFVTRVNKYLPVIGQLIDLGSELWNKKEQNDAMEKLRKARQETIASFNDMANEFERNGLCFIQDGYVAQINKIIVDYEKQSTALDTLKINKSRYVGDFKSLIEECRNLAREIRKHVV